MPRAATLHAIATDCPRLAHAAQRALHEMYVRGVTAPRISIPVHVRGETRPYRVSLTRKGRDWLLELDDSWEIVARASARTTEEVSRQIRHWEEKGA